MEKRRSAEQRNYSQAATPRKKHSALFGQDRHQPSRSSSLPGRRIGPGRDACRRSLDGNPGNPAPERLDRPFPLQTPSGGSPALTPYRSMTRHGLRRSAKKGIDFQGPVTEASIAAQQFSQPASSATGLMQPLFSHLESGATGSNTPATSALRQAAGLNPSLETVATMKP